MVDEKRDATGNEDESPEFYVPATFQFSTSPGRVERILVGLFQERGEVEVRTFTEGEEIPEFYVPAMYQISTKPGRIERFLSAVFKQRGERAVQTVPAEFRDDFYLPASNPDGFRPHIEQELAPLKPVSEATPR